MLLTLPVTVLVLLAVLTAFPFLVWLLASFALLVWLPVILLLIAVVAILATGVLPVVAFLLAAARLIESGQVVLLGQIHHLLLLVLGALVVRKQRIGLYALLVQGHDFESPLGRYGH